jgi:hypothetical protein
MRVLGGVPDAQRLGRVARGFADRSQFPVSGNDLLGLCGASATGGDFVCAGLCTQRGNLRGVHKAAGPTSGPVTGLAGLTADPVIFLVCKVPRRGTAGSRGGKDEQRRQLALLRFQKGRARATGRRHTLAVLLSG